MRRLTLALVIAAASQLTSIGQTRDGKEVSLNFLNALRATMIKGATLQDIERLLALYVEDISYEHVRFGSRVDGKVNFRKDILSHMKDYMGTEKETKFENINIMLGFNMAIVEYTQIFRATGKNTVEEVKRRKLTLLEFDRSKIKRIVDYE